MNTLAELKTIFGLDASASDARLVAEAKRCATIAADHASRAEEQSIISNLIHQSSGALSEKMARRVIANRGGFAAMKQKKS